MNILYRMCIGMVVLFGFSYSLDSAEMTQLIRKGDVAGIEKMIVQNPGLLKVDEKRGHAPLHYAVSVGNIEIIKLLLDKGMKVDCLYHQRNTPFTFAAYGGKVAIAKLLLKRGADLNHNNQFNETALVFAVRNRHHRFIDFLLDNDLRLEENIKHKKINIHEIAKAGNRRLLDRVLKLGMKVYTDSETGDSFLHSVASGGHLKYVQKIVKKSKQVNTANHFGYTPLHGAAEAGKLEVVKFLIDRGGDYKKRIFRGDSVYSLAKKSRNAKLITYLESVGANKYGEEFQSPEGKYIDPNLPGKKARIFAPGVVSTLDGFEFAGTFSPDGIHYYFTRRLKGKQRIFHSAFVNGKWSKPALAPSPLSYPNAHEYEPHVAPDGKRIFFGSWRPLPGKSEMNHTYDIWYADRTDSGWGKPVFFEPGMMYVTSTLSGKIYFNYYSKTDKKENGIYTREPKGKEYKDKVRLSSVINGLRYAAHPFIAPDESFLIFDAKVNTRLGELYIAFRKSDGSWGKPIHMGKEINNGEDSIMTASLSPDGKYLFFYRNKSIYWISASIIDDLKKLWIERGRKK